MGCEGLKGKALTDCQAAAKKASDKEKANTNFKNKAIDTIRGLQNENKRLNNLKKPNNTKTNKPRKGILAKLKSLGDKPKVKKKKVFKKGRRLIKGK
jgi:hypothetical protein